MELWPDVASSLRTPIPIGRTPSGQRGRKTWVASVNDGSSRSSQVALEMTRDRNCKNRLTRKDREFSVDCLKEAADGCYDRLTIC